MIHTSTGFGAAVTAIRGITSQPTFARDRTKEYATFTTSNSHTIASTKGKAVGEIGHNALGICESTTAAGCGCIVVSDCQNSRIQEFSLDGSKPPRVVVQFKDGSYPVSIARCGDGTNDYIVTFSGSYQVTCISGVDGSAIWTAGSEGSGVDNFQRPCAWDVVVLPNGQVVVSDQANDRLQVLDIKTGRITKQLG